MSEISSADREFNDVGEKYFRCANEAPFCVLPCTCTLQPCTLTLHAPCCHIAAHSCTQLRAVFNCLLLVFQVLYGLIPSAVLWAAYVVPAYTMTGLQSQATDPNAFYMYTGNAQKTRVFYLAAMDRPVRGE